MDKQELELAHAELQLKRQDHDLERWKLLLSIPTPVILLLLTYLVNNAIQERGALLQRESQILGEKQKIYTELGKNLNVIFVYVADVGDFRQYTPVEVVNRKRDSDRMFFMYRPYWSDDTEHKYNNYMKACFQTYNGAGLPATINASKAEKVAAYQHDGLRWENSWNGYFTESVDPNVSTKYYALVSSLLADTVSPNLRPG